MEEELESGTTTLLVDEAQKKMLKNIEKIPARITTEAA